MRRANLHKDIQPAYLDGFSSSSGLSLSHCCACGAEPDPAPDAAGRAPCWQCIGKIRCQGGTEYYDWCLNIQVLRRGEGADRGGGGHRQGGLHRLARLAAQERLAAEEVGRNKPGSSVRLARMLPLRDGSAWCDVWCHAQEGFGLKLPQRLVYCVLCIASTGEAIRMHV